MQTNLNFIVAGLFGTVLFCLLALPAQAQKNHVGKQEPQYPGGMTALVDFMVQNVKYPEAAKKENAEGMVVVKFVVEADGSLSQIKTVSEGSQNPRADFVKEAVRVIKSMPKWIPAQVNGKAASAEMTLPVKFALDGKKP